jgi:hypothetical protein
MIILFLGVDFKCFIYISNFKVDRKWTIGGRGRSFHLASLEAEVTTTHIAKTKWFSSGYRIGHNLSTPYFTGAETWVSISRTQNMSLQGERTIKLVRLYFMQ